MRNVYRVVLRVAAPDRTTETTTYVVASSVEQVLKYLRPTLLREAEIILVELLGAVEYAAADDVDMNRLGWRV